MSSGVDTGGFETLPVEVGSIPNMADPSTVGSQELQPQFFITRKSA